MLWPKWKWTFYLYIWPLTLKDDLDLDKLPFKMCGLSRCICIPNIKSLSVMAQKLWPMLKLSPNRQTNRQTDKQTNKQTNRRGKNNMPPPSILSGGHNLYTKYQMSISIGSNAMAKMKVDFFTYIFDIWPWRMTLTLTNYPSKCAAWADAYACQISSPYL